MKSHTLLIFLILIAGLALLYFFSLFGSTPQTDAKKFFMEDLETSYPDADIREVLSINKVGTGAEEYYILKARVSKNMDTPCPERIKVEYNYPARNFLKEDEKTVQGCQVCVKDSANCHISYPEEAIIASHTYNGTERVKGYIENYPSAYANAQLLENYGGEINVWEIEWFSKDSPYSLKAYISQKNNSIIGFEEISKK
jgi:hypothetical protein